MKTQSKSKKSVLNNENIHYPLKPTDIEAKYHGEEPHFLNIKEQDRKLLITKACSWYNNFYNKKDSKEFLIYYFDYNNNHNLSKSLSKVNESNFVMTYSWLARMSLRGLTLTNEEIKMLEDEAQRLIHIKKTVSDDVEKAYRPTLQDIMRDRTREAGGELEGHFDTFITEGCKNNINTKVIDELTKLNIMPQHISILVNHWEKKKQEFENVINDDELFKGYSNFTKTQLKNCVKYCETVLNDFGSYLSLKKATRAPRARKTIPVEKIVKGLKYLKTYKENGLDITSVNPVKIHGCSECYLYDTELRKLIYLVADNYTKTLSVKGTTILGFDTVKSQVKTIRKPEVQLKEFMKLGKPAGRKYFEDIKTVGVTPKGRMSDRIIILKAW